MEEKEKFFLTVEQTNECRINDVKRKSPFDLSRNH